ncbi:sugar ABC transporter substrate-binding protein [Bauldia sp.]|uniref:sugar ABC transporter substrate-binding protein n=1 Tax=Bauldia sp. TaxID=2575872 RepID=UPI003BAC9BDB
MKLKLLGLASAIALMAASTANAETVLLSMKGPGAGNPFWAAVEAGARAKADELGVELVVLSPPVESDVQSQIAQVEDQLVKNIDALVIAPTDPNAVSPIVQQTIAEGVGVVFIDTKGIDEGVTFIGTNNSVGAALGAEYICLNVESGSDVAILQGIITQSTGKDRADGAHAGLEACGMNIVAEQPAEWDTAKAQSAMENILTGNPNLKAVFASNDNMALGAVEALKSAGMLDQVVVVGFDANPNAADSILAGEMSATVAQNPFNMGAFGVENALKIKAGEEIPLVIDTGTILVTEENAPEFQ